MERKYFEKEATKAVFNKDTKSYDVKKTFKVKGILSIPKNGDPTYTLRVSMDGRGSFAFNAKENKKTKGIILDPVFRKLDKFGEEESTALSAIDKIVGTKAKQYLLSTMNMKEMKWENLIKKFN